MSSFAEKQKEMKEKAAQEAIYEAAIRLISEKNGEGLKMQEIAEAAGIATGTLYNYFKDKVELLSFVDRRLHVIILCQIEETAGSTLRPDKKLETVIQRMLSFCREYHCVFDLAEQFGIKDRVPKKEKIDNLNHVYNCIKNILDEGVDQNYFRQVDTTATAELFFLTIIGVIEIQKWLQEYEMLEQIEKLRDFFLAYLEIHHS